MLPRQNATNVKLKTLWTQERNAFFEACNKKVLSHRMRRAKRRPTCPHYSPSCQSDWKTTWSNIPESSRIFPKRTFSGAEKKEGKNLLEIILFMKYIARSRDFVHRGVFQLCLVPSRFRRNTGRQSRAKTNWPRTRPQIPNYSQAQFNCRTFIRTRLGNKVKQQEYELAKHLHLRAISCVTVCHSVTLLHEE